MDELKIILVGLIIGLFISFSFQPSQSYSPYGSDVSVNTDERDGGEVIIDEGFVGGVKRQIEPDDNPWIHPRHEG